MALHVRDTRSGPRIFVFALIGLLVSAAGVRAEVPASEPVAQGHRLQWNPEWPSFRPIGYVLTGASVLGAITVTLLVEYPDLPRWRGGILFDDAFRAALRARNAGARDAVRLASDITLIASIVQVGLVDSVILPVADRSPAVAAQLSLINAQAFSLNILIATLLFKAVARERPLIADCKKDPNFDPLCNSGSYASFPSSHTSTAFTAAGLSCVHHAYLPLYGGGAWDMAACIESIAVATATGMFRIIGDRHYATDVLFGAAIGFSIGYIYPWLFHYRYGSDPPPERRSSGSATSFSVVPAPPYGLTFAGTF